MILGVCFLITGYLKTKNIWKAWLQHSLKDNVDVKYYAHISNPDNNCMLDDDFQTVNCVKTKWADPSIVIAERNLFNKAFEECDFVILVSQDTIPLKSAKEFIIYIKKYNKSILDTISWKDISKKYGINCGSQFLILKKASWNIINDNWDKHFDIFANKYNKDVCCTSEVCMDELFIHTMFDIYNIEYENKNIIYSTEYVDPDHADELTPDVIDNIDPKYLISRKFKDSYELQTKLHFLNV